MTNVCFAETIECWVMIMEIMGNLVIMPLIDGNHFSLQRMVDKVKDG
jgi:hypothetical protein